MTALGIFLLIYGILALTHIIIQLIFGHLEYRRQNHHHFRAKYKNHHESVSVVVPVYNELPTSLDECISSLIQPGL